MCQDESSELSLCWLGRFLRGSLDKQVSGMLLLGVAVWGVSVLHGHLEMSIQDAL